MSSPLTASGLSFETPNGRTLFRNLSFTLSDRITALVGPNGVGKTSLARLLAAELEPAAGHVRRTQAVSFLPQREVAPSVSVAHYLGDLAWNLVREELLAPIDREALCTQLSGGEWMRVRFARAIGDRYLILDEPSNDLDREGKDVILRFLRAQSAGVLLISHDRELLAVCDEVLELSARGLAKHGGGWARYEKDRDVERANLDSTLEVAKRERDAAFRERNDARLKQDKRNERGRAAAARGGMPRILTGARKRRAEATTGRVDSETLNRADDSVREAHEAFENLKLDPVMYADLLGQPIPKQKMVVEAKDFNIYFRRWIYPTDLSFRWCGNVRLAIRGANGAGKSSLLKAILGTEIITRGEFRRGNLSMLSVDQSCSQLDDDLSIFENVRAVSDLTDPEIRNGLAKFLFTKDSVLQKVRTLSGGERLRATLARGFLRAQAPEVLILDEATNNLDLVNIRFLEDLVAQFPGALIVISHDEVFLENCRLEEELVLPSCIKL